MANLIILNSLIIISAIILGIANICLLSGLLYFYLDSYKKLKSKFSVGLIYFALIFLTENIIAILSLSFCLIYGIEISEITGIIIYSLLLLVNLGQLIAFGILFKITWD